MMTRQGARDLALQVIRNPENTEGVHEKIADALFDVFEGDVEGLVPIPHQAEWPATAFRVILAFDIPGVGHDVFYEVARTQEPAPVVDLNRFAPIQVHSGLFLSTEKARAFAQLILDAPDRAGGIVIVTGEDE